jgi:TolA-binding protein
VGGGFGRPFPETDMQVNGHKISLGNVLTVLGMLVGLGATWATLSADNADTKRRVTTVEDRQKEDRRDIKQRLEQFDERSRRTDENVQKILGKIEAMERRR